MRRKDMPNGHILVTLSKRNLLALLHKLEMAGSFRTLISPDEKLAISVETDEEHYGGRDHPPGEMHPQTEAFLKGGN